MFVYIDTMSAVMSMTLLSIFSWLSITLISDLESISTVLHVSSTGRSAKSNTLLAGQVTSPTHPKK